MKKIAAIILLFIFVFAQAVIAQQFTGKPRYQIITKRNNIVLGTIEIELFPTIAPKHVRNFDSLVSQNFYDNTAFHRVAPAFVIQGGDPNSKTGPDSTWGSGQPGQPTVDAEFSAVKHVRGILSAARDGNDINSANSQFFICVVTENGLNGNYSAYGRVTSGMVVVDTIVKQPTVFTGTLNTERPKQKIEMFITYLGSNDSIPATPILNSPANNSLGLDTNVSFQLKWDKAPGSILYHLDVSTDSLFVSDTVRSVNLSNNFYFLNKLKGNTRYHWRIRSTNGGNWSVSERRSFHTKSETTNITVLSGASPFRVFPNPATGLFTFENVMSGNTVEITDLEGRTILIETAVDNNLKIDLQKKDKGMYFYKISSGSNTVQKGSIILQ